MLKSEQTNILDHFYRVSAKALIFDEKRKFLLLIEDNGGLDFPGGGVDYGEEPTECLKREIEEETGLKVTNIKEKPSYVILSKHRSGDYWICNIFYDVKVEDYNFQTSGECVDMKFFSKEEALKENIIPNVAKFLVYFNPENHSQSHND